MDDFIAKNAKQLDICLKLLYAECIKFTVSVDETRKGNIIYVVTADTNDETKKLLREKYRILIS